MSVLVGKKLNKVIDEGRVAYLFECPGCGGPHMVYVDGTNRHGTPPNWEWNGDGDRPTFHPSVNVAKDDPRFHCHSWVRDGMITFLSDCHHDLKNTTVEIPDWDSV